MIIEKKVAYEQYLKIKSSTTYRGFLVLTDGQRITVPAHLLDLCKLKKYQRN